MYGVQEHTVLGTVLPQNKEMAPATKSSWIKQQCSALS